MAQTPPPDIEPADLWQQITAMPRAHRPVDFPRKGPDGAAVAQVAVVVLTQEETMAANLQADRHVRKLMQDAKSLPNRNEMSGGYSNLFEMRASMEILFRACRRSGDLGKPFFPIVEAIGKSLTTDEIAVLMNQYVRVQAELGPIVSKMDQEEVDVWIERLATGGSAFPLDSLSSGALTALVMSMASRLWILSTDNSSPGSPPEEST